MAARFDSKAIRDLVREGSGASPSMQFAEVRAKLGTMPSLLADAYPDLRMTTSSLAHNQDPELTSKIQGLSRRLHRTHPGYNSAHSYPLHRLLEQLGVSYEFYFGSTQETYGHVGLQ
jgi:hypothetical protein